MKVCSAVVGLNIIFLFYIYVVKPCLKKLKFHSRARYIFSFSTSASNGLKKWILVLSVYAIVTEARLPSYGNKYQSNALAGMRMCYVRDKERSQATNWAHHHVRLIYNDGRCKDEKMFFAKDAIEVMTARLRGHPAC